MGVQSTLDIALEQMEQEMVKLNGLSKQTGGVKRKVSLDRANEIRTTFLEFFEKKGHRIIPSSSLIPKDDRIIILPTPAMNQFKNIFLGLEKRSYNRATTVQNV
jgi:hypothetical protein